MLPCEVGIYVMFLTTISASMGGLSVMLPIVTLKVPRRKSALIPMFPSSTAPIAAAVATDAGTALASTVTFCGGRSTCDQEYAAIPSSLDPSLPDTVTAAAVPSLSVTERPPAPIVAQAFTTRLLSSAVGECEKDAVELSAKAVLFSCPLLNTLEESVLAPV